MKKILFIIPLVLLSILAVVKPPDNPQEPPGLPIQSPLNPGGSPAVLAATNDPLFFTVNIPAIFNEDITAPNVLYSLKAGSGISVSSGQTPTIANTGVLSLQGSTGILSLEAGTGITLDGLKLTNSDLGSSQNIFKTIKSGSSSFSAGSNSDTLEFAGSGGVTLALDTSSKKLTITSATPDYTLSGWTAGTGVVYPSTLTDKVGIGTLTPTSTLHVIGTTYLSDLLTAAGGLSVTGNTQLHGLLISGGDMTLGAISSDSLTFSGRLADGSTFLPDTNLGADLGSSALRFDNIWVNNIMSNDSQDFSGKTVFSYAPTATTLAGSSVLINPTTSVSNGQLLGVSIAGNQDA